MIPDFIGIGVQKCATGWMARVLDAHPRISLAWSREGKKNLHFFDHHYDRGFEWYESHFETTFDGLCGEYSTSYYYSTDARKRIASRAPEARIVVSLRDPVERAYAQHKHQLIRGRVSGRNEVFETALDDNPTYLEQSMYFTHLSRWVEFFGRDRIYPVLLETARDEPDKVVAGLYDWLEVDPEFRPEILHHRVHQSSSGVSSVLDRALSKLRGRPMSFPPLDDSTRARLQEHFREENMKLSELFDLDLSCWTQ